MENNEFDNRRNNIDIIKKNFEGERKKKNEFFNKYLIKITIGIIKIEDHNNLHFGKNIYKTVNKQFILIIKSEP